jgi:hypothetical protein
LKVPTLIVTNTYFLDVQEGHRAVELRVESRTADAIFTELHERFPQFPRSERYALIRESDDEDVRYLPDETVFGDDERFYLLDTVGC